MQPEQDRLPVSPFVIRAASVSAMRDADAIRKAAHAEAAQLRADAVREGEALHAAEVQRGSAQGAAQAAGLIAATEDAIETFWASRETELVDLALAIAHRVIGSLPADAQLAALARTALAEHKDEAGLVLQTAPGTASRLRGALTASGRPDWVVEADPSLPPESCVLVHRRGSTRLGLLDQFRELMAAQRR